MAIPERFIEELVLRSDILDVVSRYVDMKKKGLNHFGLCPFHGEKTPSFSVNTDKQIYHCFGCGAGGGVINFIMQIERLAFPDAVAHLAGLYGLTVPEDRATGAAQSRTARLRALHLAAARHFRDMLHSPRGAAAREYLERRRLSPATVAKFGLGFAPDVWDSLLTAMREAGFTQGELVEGGLAVAGKQGRVYDRFRNRVMFPIIDVRGDVIAFGGRVMDSGEPKYLNSPETPIFSKGRHLYALQYAKKADTRHFLLAEGYMDVIALHQAGFGQTVATLGTALTQEQAKLLRRYADTATIVYDADSAGQAATQKAIGILKTADMAVRVLRLPGAKDPDEFIRANGPEAFSALLARSQGDMDFRLSQLRGQANLDSPEGKVGYVKNATALLAGVEDAVEREVYAQRVAQETGITVQSLLAEVEKERNTRRKKEQQKLLRDNQAPVRQVQPAARALRYQNPRAARAEEGVIALLFHDAGLAAVLTREGITAAQFSSPFLAKTLDLILGRGVRGQAVSLPTLAQELSREEMEQLAGIVQEQPVSAPEQALGDYIAVIRAEQKKNTEDLASFSALMRAKKGAGGNEG